MAEKCKEKINHLLVLTALIQAGCAPLLIGSGVETVLIARDPRTSGTQLEDQIIAQKFLSNLNQTIKITDSVHINATSYNRRLLLTGEVPNQNIANQVYELAKKTENVEQVFNELAIQSPSSLSERSSDALVTFTVRGSLLANAAPVADSFKVVTESGVVYLLGYTTEKITQQAIDLIRKINGVKRVVILVERKNN